MERYKPKPNIDLKALQALDRKVLKRERAQKRAQARDDEAIDRQEELWEEEQARREDYERRKRAGKLTEEENRHAANMAAVKCIADAYREIEVLQAKLEAARKAFKREVMAATSTILEDHRRFYAAGGCTFQQYMEWLGGGRDAQRLPVRKRKHLRLVVENKTRKPALPRLRQREV